MSVNLQSCGNNVQDILHLIAASLVKDAQGVVYIRMNAQLHDCADIEPFVTCANSHVSPEELIKNAIMTDDCGENLIINISAPNSI
jgi:hypothetical protein